MKNRIEKFAVVVAISFVLPISAQAAMYTYGGNAPDSAPVTPTGNDGYVKYWSSAGENSNYTAAWGWIEDGSQSHQASWQFNLQPLASGETVDSATLTINNLTYTVGAYIGYSNETFPNPSDARDTVSDKRSLTTGTSNHDVTTWVQNWYAVENTGVVFQATGSGVGGAKNAAVDNVVLTVNTVPEPTTFALAGLGLIGLLAVRRRR